MIGVCRSPVPISKSTQLREGVKIYSPSEGGKKGTDGVLQCPVWLQHGRQQILIPAKKLPRILSFTLDYMIPFNSLLFRPIRVCFIGLNY